MAVPKNVLFLILAVMFLNEVSVCWCGSLEHPLVGIIKEVLNEKVISIRCANALRIFLYKLSGDGVDDIWALQMLDATSKVPVSLLSHSFREIGHFYQCTELEAVSENIKGKYCIGNIVINASVAEIYAVHFHNKNIKYLLSKIGGRVKMVGNPQWAMCLPHNCTSEDTMVLMNKSQPFGLGVNSVTCQTIEDVYPSLTRDAVIGMSILSFLAFIVLLSTSYDIFCQNNKKAHPGLISFSLYTNGKKLFQIPNRSANLTCLDGIRVLSMFWIITLHTWTIYTSGPVYNSKDVVKMSNSILSMAFTKGDLACDTFLLVGGILVTYVYFKKYNYRNLRLSNVFRHYFHRVIRLTPPLAGVTLISATLLRYMGSGPNWPIIVNFFEGFCKKYWWSTLLYVQNEVNVNEMCVGHSWYLSVDMQLYLFSPLIFWILSKYSKTGIILLILASFWSICLGFVRAFKNELSGLYPNSYSKTPSYVYMNEYYLKTETRAAPWIMGTILGYILTKKTFTEISLPKKITIPMWILTFAVIILCVFGGFSTLRGPEYNRLQNAFYISFVRPSFAMTVGWVIWACSTNHGGIVNSILSLQIFQFLNKFVYSMYLIHVTSLYMIIFSTKTTLYISIFNLAYWFWGIFMFMFGISIIWVLVFEMPIVALEKVILPPSDPKEECIKIKSNEKSQA